MIEQRKRENGAQEGTDERRAQLQVRAFEPAETLTLVIYGEVPERPEELRAIRAAWDRVRETAPPRETDSP